MKHYVRKGKSLVTVIYFADRGDCIDNLLIWVEMHYNTNWYEDYLYYSTHAIQIIIIAINQV